jgi:polar amino acid transport system substrate-binding protein
MIARTRALVVLLAVAALAVSASGCGGGDDEGNTTATTTGSASITPPQNIADAGKIVYCSDITYPPEEFYEGSTAKGVTAQFDNTGFDGIIPALLSKKCDAIISGMNDTAERRQQVLFVDYIDVGQSFMIQKGNPKNITNVPSLSGKSASVEVGTTNKDYLDDQNEKLKKQGKAPIDIVTFPKDTDAANALKTGKVDAYFGDSPVVLYYISQDPKSFQVAENPEVVNPIPVGIAIRKEDTELRDAVQKAVDAMYADGKMAKILAVWKMSAFAMKK